jgi:flagellin
MDRYFQKEIIMAFSINTNVNAMAALQSMNKTNKGLDQVQSRISSGMNVASTKDDSATFITAQRLRGKLSDTKAVTSSLNNAKSVVDVAVSAAEQISDAVNNMKTLAKQAADTTITDVQRSAYSDQFKAQIAQITTFVKSAEFNGTNLLDSAATQKTVGALQSLSGAEGTPDTLTVGNQGLDLPATGIDPDPVGPPIVGGTLGQTSGLPSANAAKGMEKLLNDYTTNKVQPALTNLGTAARKIDAQLSFNSKVADTLESGIGNLVDADMAKEAAKLTALQTKQQLGMQALSIANQGPQSIGQLFRG